jgi:Peptidase family S41
MKLLAILLLPLASAAQPKQAATADREAQWRQDLQFFAEQFSNGHCTAAELFHSPLTALLPCHQTDFAKLYPQPTFSNEIRAIEENITTLTDSQIVLRLARLVASAHVGHTYVGLPALKLGFRPIAVSFRWFADGLAIVSTTPEHTAALGTRVLKIGPLTAEQALAAVAPYISYENQNYLRAASPPYLNKMAVLREIGAVGEGNTVTFTLAKAGGQPFTLSVKPREPNLKDVSAYDELHVPLALYRKHPSDSYWYEYLSDSHTLYIQYNRCANDPKQSMGDFARGLFEAVDARTVDRTIVDLRFNGGGDSRVINPLKSGLRARRSPVFVLIGDSTFSSAQDNAIEMRRELNATLVGEPTGEKLNSYGEVRQLNLPNSGLHIQYSTQFYRMQKDSDADALYPDIAAPRTLADFLAGRDPALDAALHGEPRRSEPRRVK